MTLPFDASVVATAHSDDWSGPYRTSLPSMFGADAEMPAARMACVAVCSCGTVSHETGDEQDHHGREDAPSPARTFPTILPNV